MYLYTILQVFKLIFHDIHYVFFYVFIFTEIYKCLNMGHTLGTEKNIYQSDCYNILFKIMELWIHGILFMLNSCNSFSYPPVLKKQPYSAYLYKGLHSIKFDNIKSFYFYQCLSPTVVEMTKISFHLKKSLLSLSLRICMD